MVIRDIYSVRRIRCSPCPNFHLFWSLDDSTYVLLEECWFALPQLFFTCYLRPRDGNSQAGRCTYGEDDIQVQLMFYSTFEVLDLPGSGLMETRHVVKLCEPSPTPIL